MRAQRKILFLAGEGTLLDTPGRSGTISDAPRLTAGVVAALLKLHAAGYALVLVEAGGSGTPAPPNGGTGVRTLLPLLESQGIRFEIGREPGNHDQRSRTATPPASLALDYLRCGDLDRAASAVVGAHERDLDLARDLGVRGFRLGADHQRWDEIAHLLADAPRVAEVERRTRETRVRVRVDLDREAAPEVATGLGFFDHMLEQLGKHGGFALTLDCAGDTHVDEHHTVEDSALALGEALRRALGDKRGIERYGFALPMDEARAEALLDLSGRPYFVFDGTFARERVGQLPTELVPHFFRSLAEGLGANLHLSVRGDNAHHMVEACFKATARALRLAVRRGDGGVPSTKGAL
jgi:imidazoleglycerol-phosphate dehydratase/histidinol-phosphatase